MQKSALLAAIQREIHRHDFSHFIDEPPSIAEGGKGVVVPGCPACKVRINTTSQFLDHLANDAMPRLIDRLSNTCLLCRGLLRDQRATWCVSGQMYTADQRTVLLARPVPAVLLRC